VPVAPGPVSGVSASSAVTGVVPALARSWRSVAPAVGVTVVAVVRPCTAMCRSFHAVVVTVGATWLVVAFAVALAVASIGLVVSTPVYAAMPPAAGFDPDSVHTQFAGSPPAARCR